MQHLVRLPEAVPRPIVAARTDLGVRGAREGWEGLDLGKGWTGRVSEKIGVGKG